MREKENKYMSFHTIIFKNLKILLVFLIEFLLIFL